MSNYDDEIIVTDERNHFPVMVNSDVFTDKRLNLLDVAVYSYLSYLHPEVIDIKVVEAINARFGTTKEQVIEVFDKLTVSGLLNNGGE